MNFYILSSVSIFVLNNTGCFFDDIVNNLLELTFHHTKNTFVDSLTLLFNNKAQKKRPCCSKVFINF